jgi:hypothetical protein
MCSQKSRRKSYSIFRDTTIIVCLIAKEKTPANALASAISKAFLIKISLLILNAIHQSRFSLELVLNMAILERRIKRNREQAYLYIVQNIF